MCAGHRYTQYKCRRAARQRSVRQPAMKLYTYVLTLSACALLARAASIPCDKNVDDLSNVDLDDVAVQPELTDQAPIKEVDNNLRKTIVDIPVKVVEGPVVLDENSNDYVPKDDGNFVVKRIEVDLSNPGEPQRQEHETQNPENHGDLEKAIFSIKKSAIDAEKAFNEGFEEVSNSFKSLFGAKENLPEAHQKLDNLRSTVANKIEKIQETIASSLKSDESLKEKLKAAESYVQNLKKSFDSGIDTLTEGIELLTIIREEDEAIKTKSVIDPSGALKADGETTNTGSTGTAQPPPTNAISQALASFQQNIQGMLNNIQNNFASLTSGQGTNPFASFFQGLTGANNQNQKPADTQNPPAGAQADPVVATSPPATSAPWGPQAFFQQVQNTFQNLVNPGQNVQQDSPQAQQSAQQPAQQSVQQTAQQPATNGPITQAFQNVLQFIQRPGQIFTNQQQQQKPQQQQQTQPQQQQPQAQQQQPQAQQQQPQTQQQQPQQQQSDPPSENPQNEVPQANASPVVPAKAEAVPAAPQQAQVSAQPAQGPIQQLVQNNPIIKGIQNAVQRFQGTPNPETPRNEVVVEEVKEITKLKGRPDANGNRGDLGCSGVEEVKEEIKEVAEIVKDNEAVLEEIKEEVAKLPSPSDKTE